MRPACGKRISASGKRGPGRRWPTRFARWPWGCARLGFGRGDNLAIIGDNRPQLYWAMAAAQCLGGVPVPLYQDAVAEEMIYILDDADVRIAVVEDQEQVDKLLEIKDRLPKLRAHRLRRPARHAALPPDVPASLQRAAGARPQLDRDAPGRFERRGGQGPRQRCGDHAVYVRHHRQAEGRVPHA